MSYFADMAKARQWRQQEEALLGRATTRELLLEIKARGEGESRYREQGDALSLAAASLLASLPTSMLEYRVYDA